MLGTAPSQVIINPGAARSPSPVQNSWTPRPPSVQSARHSCTSNTELNWEANKATDLQDALAANFKDAQQHLADILESALGLVGRSLTSSKRLEAEVLALRVENHKMRARMDQMRKSQTSPDEAAMELLSSASMDSGRIGSSKTRQKEIKVGPVRSPSGVSGFSQAVELPGDVDQPPPPCVALSSVVPVPPEQESLTHLNPEEEIEPICRTAHFSDEDEEGSDDSEQIEESKGKVVCFDGGISSRRVSDETIRSSHRPAAFEVLPLWAENHKKFSQKLGLTKYDVGKTNRDGGSVVQSQCGTSSGHFAAMESEDSRYQSETWTSEAKTWRETCQDVKCVPPNSQLRSLWDIGSCLLVFYDIIMIPLEFMEPGQSGFTSAMRWITRLFWSFDMPFSFATGFVTSDGGVELGFRQVAIRYLSTWFVLDLLLVCIDWLEIVLGKNTNSLGFLRAGRGSRGLRILRLVRLLRLLRVGSVMLVIAERVRSERLIILADIFNIVFAILLVAHVMACLWYGLGNDQDGTSWVQVENIRGESLSLRYSTSLHWSLTQFSGGMDEIKPYSVVERAFTIVAFLFAFILAAVFVSRLTSSMTRLHMLSNTQAQQIVALRRYLGQNGITHKLALRIQKNAMHAHFEQQCLTPEDKVELLHLVSEPLLMELHLELYFPSLCAHPFFGPYIEECPHVMRKVCHLAMSTVQVHVGDVVFNAGEIPLSPKMYMVNNGELMYTAMVSGEAVVVTTGQWLSEMALWTNWMHRGVLTASSICRLCILDAVKFQDIAGRFEHPKSFNPRAYASHYVTELNQIEGEITDLLIVSFPLAQLRRRGSRMNSGAKPEGLRGILTTTFAMASKGAKFGTRSLTRSLELSGSRSQFKARAQKTMSRFFGGH